MFKCDGEHTPSVNVVSQNTPLFGVEIIENLDERNWKPTLM